MLKEYDCVRLRKPLSDDSVPVGSDGVVLAIYKEPSLGYEVEFFDSRHRSLGTFTTTENDRVYATLALKSERHNTL